MMTNVIQFPSEIKYSYHEEDNKLQIVKTQDVSNVLDAVKRIKSETVGKRSKNLKYEGSIPLVIAAQWAKECGARMYSNEWKAYALKKLRSPEFKYLRGE
jgi:hypothetical protein